MGRPKRVLSFMSQWGGGAHLQKQQPPPSTSASSAPPSPSKQPTATASLPQSPSQSTFAQSATALDSYNEHASPSPGLRNRSDSRASRASSRPMSMIQTYQPPVMDIGADTLPELYRIFSFFNGHSNKLYQEGYFLKFHDTDSRGRPAPERKWQEYFVQLVGTILSLWDASALDQAGGDAEVLPTFINLTDASIHMIPSMTLKDGKKLDNILSVSTAAHNKYLFHFDSYHALSQWTAGIRLAMFEHTSLSEAYTGALIAGKGKQLNNIRDILDRQCAVYDDWVRVRFGAGSPWRRCWCVVSPPDQKEYAKLQKSQKKSNPYDRPVVLKGDIKFYDTNKIKKKTKPIATVRDAYSCFAIYPQSKQLIDQSTLVKIEGKITIHSTTENTTDGFVFIMPEARPAVLGIEIMLQFLFPIFDTFALYGRPKKLVADVLDTRGLMFGMPPDRRYGYLEIWDVVGLINTDGSQVWSERQWRKQLKDLTSTRMATGSDVDASSRGASRRNTVSRAGFTPSRSNLRFDDHGSIRSSPSTRRSSPTRQARLDSEPQVPRRVGTAPPTGPFGTPRHQRSVSEANGYNNFQTTPSRLAQGQMVDAGEFPPTPPPHGGYSGTLQNGRSQYPEASDSDESLTREPRNLPEFPVAASAPPSGQVDQPPALTHAPYQQPPIRPSLPSGMKPNAAVDSATFQQMADATNVQIPVGIAAAGAAAAWRSQESIHSRRSGEYSTYPDGGQQMYLGANSRPPPSDRTSEHRLPTIPASPYVEHAEFVQPSHSYQPVAPPVPEHAEMPQQWSQELPHRPHSGSGSGYVPRKPVPGRSPSASQEDDTRSTTSSTLGSLRNQVVGPEALDALEALDKREARQREAMLQRQQSQASSRYDDDAISTSTPDYASVASEEIQPRKVPVRPEDRPRNGILKIAGDPNLIEPRDVDSKTTPIASSMLKDVPDVSFGYVPDLATTLGKRPGTSGTMTQGTHDENFSGSRENLASTPNEQRRQSYLAGRTTPNAGLQHSPQAPEPRTVAWHPGMASPQQQPGRQSLNAEEWVRQRAAQSQPLVYGHGRSNSHTPPPFGRQRSGDWAHLQRTPDCSPALGRPPSRPLSRPQSRGADVLLDARPTSLTARERETISQMTGTPLVDLSEGNRHRKQQSSHTLTGFIEGREKERAAAKANRQGNSVAMQAEIDRRLQQIQQRQLQEAQNRQRRMLELQQQQMQAAMAQNQYAQSEFQFANTPTGAPSIMGMSMGTPSVMGMPMGTPSVMGMPTGPGTPQAMVGMAYSSPHQVPQGMYQPQGYFPQPAMTPNTNMMPGGWGAPTPQSPQAQYFQQQMNHTQQQQPPATPAYGADFDKEQAARLAQQQRGQSRR
ncbi:hypothetical protein CC86DRAFT_134654 [Ophiobolus disseminans]|uniref:PH domain-containing protein n=1 Tax=Ophiobolus disseminans TaxID=1469910 RepID=A0A6A7ACN2_9PLEO|nr:hypothetical protein CC86DRAFT_134654 [Ophiobolus disseminans]